MAHKDARVDAYIAQAADFAKPILTHLRAVVHAACPDAQETIKWRMPFFVYNDKNLCYMAAFKQHCGFGFWKGGRIVDDVPSDPKTSAAGDFGRITALSDLPSKSVLTRYIKKAMQVSQAS